MFDVGESPTPIVLEILNFNYRSPSEDTVLMEICQYQVRCESTPITTYMGLLV